MTDQERIKELAEQAGILPSFQNPDVWICHDFELKRFAELVRQDQKERDYALMRDCVLTEREACAKLCESMGVHPALNVCNGGPEWYQRQKECAAAIRARSKHD